MSHQFGQKDLCKRCREGLRFPTVDYPSLSPEDVLAQSSLVKTAQNPSGPYSLEHGLHRFECYYFHEDSLPGLPILTSTAHGGCVFCRSLRDAILSCSTPASASFSAVRVSLDYLWDITPGLSQDGATVTKWILRAQLHVYDLSIAERVNDPDLSYSCWRSGHTLCWPLSRDSGAKYGLQLRMPPPMPETSLEERNVSFLRSNTNQCLNSCSHKALVSGTFVPSRLIDLRGGSLRIVEAQDAEREHAQDMRYSTLSYCWGNREEGLSQLRLTKNNAPQLQSGFSFDAMSPVQQDAVLVSRALRIPYLWIDALCILQGDTADWERESSMMHKIYSGSLLTICNIKTGSCQQSFRSREQQLTIPFDTLTSSEASECFRVGPSFKTEAPVRVSAEDTWTRLEFESTQWVTRAWTFQEAAMSTRMILFADSGIYYNCSAGLVWEYDRVIGEPLRFSVSSILECGSKAEIYKRWNLDIATQFSGRQATYLTDSLPALSGLAQIFAPVLEDEYVAGLWKGDLLTGLFWKLKGSLASSLDKLLASFDGLYVGPSWSWIGRAIDTGNYVGQVRSFGPGLCPLYPRKSTTTVVLHQQCDVLEATSMPLGSDRFGRIGSATLLITGRVYPLSLGCCNIPDGSQHEGMLHDTGNFCVEQPDGTRLCFSYYLDFFPNSTRKSRSRNWALDLTLVLIGGAQYIDDDEEEESIQEPYGLIVHKATARDSYWRIGTFGPASSEDELEGVYDLSIGFFQTCEKTTLKVI